MSNLIQQEQEERWYEEGLEIAKCIDFTEPYWDLFATSYVSSMRELYTWGVQHRTYLIHQRQV